jgi:hypothetical protein
MLEAYATTPKISMSVFIAAAGAGADARRGLEIAASRHAGARCPRADDISGRREAALLR